MDRIDPSVNPAPEKEEPRKEVCRYCKNPHYEVFHDGLCEVCYYKFEEMGR